MRVRWEAARADALSEEMNRPALRRPVGSPLAAVILFSLAAVMMASAEGRALETAAKRAILLDDATGTVIFEKNADDLMPPASMSKLMTVVMVFQELSAGKLALEDTFPVSEKAWRMGGSKMFVEVGKRVSVADLLRGIIVQSGNDATIVVAEGLSGSEEAFAEEMTQHAREIGLTDSVFKNASGWPSEGHVMTARDLAVLAHHTVSAYPGYYPYYAETNFTFSGIEQRNRNPMLGKVKGVDGLKTGHTEEAGYGLTASAERDGRRLILVIAGLESSKQRAKEAERLLEHGFRNFDVYPLLGAGEAVLEAPVWLGESATVPLVIEDELTLTLSREARRKMVVKAVYDSPVPAPITQGDEIGKLVVDTGETIEIPLRAGADVPVLTMFRRLRAAVEHLVWGPPAPSS